MRISSAAYQWRLFLVRPISTLLLITLIAPMIFFGARERTFASIPSPAVRSLPPEPFHVGTRSLLLTSSLEAGSGLVKWAADLIGTLPNLVLASIGNALSGRDPVLQLSGSVDFDFDGDGKAEIGRWHAPSTEFKIKGSSTGTASTFALGSSPGVAAPADFDGDGATDAAVFAVGTWTYKKSSDGTTQTISFGAAGDVPYPGDYDGDGIDDFAVFRPSTSVWWVRESGTSNVIPHGVAITGDIPVPGNYDGDAKTDLAVFRPSTGVWYIYGSAGTNFTRTWGYSTDITVPADYDGDGKTDIAVFRPSTGTWYVLTSSSTFASMVSQVWGNYRDQPVPADYDGDGLADFAVWRPTTGVWHIFKSQTDTYDAQGLGAAGDAPLPAAYISKIGGVVAPDELGKARLTAQNATGGTDLYSRNFSWGTSLVNLPGRAGMNAGFGMSYNSLVWAKVGGAVYFDPNYDNIGPGFRFGFPVIEPSYYDDDKQKFVYLMVAPSGGRVEFRQSAVSNIYETADSSYLQLKTKGAADPNTPSENVEISVTGTDGTVMKYAWRGGAYRCYEIKDRNGNYISIDHDELGLLRTVTDTLGRVVTVEYDAEYYPTAIKQTWKGGNGAGSDVAHTWASFAYTTATIDTDFYGLTVLGPADQTAIKVLEKVTYPDGSSTKFDYNGYAQVYKISSIAADSDELNYVRTNLQTPAANQTDCPRFSATASWVKNFNLDQYGYEQETVVTNTITPGQAYSLPGGISGTATMIEAAMAGHPHGAISRTFVGGPGWAEGLPIATEDWADGPGGLERKRWTWANWTQDDTGRAYQLNPRVTETRVGDSANVKKTAAEYLMESNSAAVSRFGLVAKTETFDSDLSTVLKRTEIDYDLSSAYLGKRIIGLPSEVRSYGFENSALALVSKVTYAYDEGDFGSSSLSQNISPVQHDSTDFGASFIAGRGNLTGTTRWNVEFPTSSTEAVTSSIKYNTAGAVVSQTDPMSRTVEIAYADDFNASGSFNTFAYPTRVTDPAGNSSTVKYRFDTGANVRAQSPAPAGQSQGKITERLFDSIGRLSKETVVNNGAYTRYEYPTNGVQSKTFSTITDTNANGADSADEVMTESWSDGAGRVRMARTEHPGSTGGWSGVLTEYDVLGRVSRQSVPTEVNASYQAWGDDAVRGFLWTHQKYDWMGRVVRKINTDGEPDLPENDSDIFISYEGCGCAGGLVTTIESELVPRSDAAGKARRKQKIYQDILGRAFKSETFEWNGTTVYSTNINTFNGRDRVVLARQYAGTASSSTYQDTTAAFDGHGRLKTSHRPEQRDSGNNPTVTTYNYNADDSISSVVDARGAVTGYTYNSRGLPEQISYSVPSESAILVTPTATFAYDNVGNRISMTDGLGSVGYAYDELSRMLSEERDFTDDLPDAPVSGGKFKLEYTYDLSGGLKSLKDPYGQQFNYDKDKMGRLQSVIGSTAFNSITTYASNPSYNARGILTALNYGNGVGMSITGFSNKLQATGLEVKKGTNSYIEKKYEFYPDGSLNFIDDGLDETFDRLYKYDHVGRTVEAKAGTAAREQAATGPHNFDQPYTMQYTHDAFGHVTDKTGYYYSSYDVNSYSYTNNRNPAWIYDADGNVISDADAIYQTDAAGRIIKTTQRDFDNPQQFHAPTASYFDGTGGLTKRTAKFGATHPQTRLFIRSSVLNKVVSEVSGSGKKSRTFVPANGSTLAEQIISYDGTTEILRFAHQDASGSGVQQTGSDGSLVFPGRTAEYDAMGRNVANSGPYTALDSEPLPDVGGGIDMFGSGDGYRPGRGAYMMDGQVVSESQFMLALNSGAIGGAFGLIEMAARMSIPTLSHFSVGDAFMYPTVAGANAAIGQAMDSGGPIVRHWFVNDFSWLVLNSLSPLHIQGDVYTETALTEQQKRKLRDGLKSFTNNEACNKFITGVLKKLASSGRNGYDTTNINKLFEMIFGNGNNVFRSVNYIEAWDKGLVKRVPYAVTSFGWNGAVKRTTMRFDSYYFGFESGNVQGRLYTYSEFNSTATLVHELIHAFGNTEYFDHGDQAETAFAMATDMGIDVKAVPNRKDFLDPITNKLDGRAFDDANSAYFDKLLKNACSGSR